jgi:hypothetical protein
MRGSCGKCGQTFDGQMLCPQCGVQLLEEGEGVTLPPPVIDPDEAADGRSFLRRCALGGITLVGSFQGLKHLASAGLLVQTGSASLSAETVLSLVVLATLAAAVLAGTVNRRAEVAGVLLGAGAAAGLIGVDLACGERPPEAWLVGVPMGLVLLGAVGGYAGRRIMPPTPSLPRFGRREAPDRARSRSRPPRLAWLRVLVGVFLAVGGTVYADEIRTGLTRIFAGPGGSFAAGRLVTWQITVIAALAGGFAAGASTRRGLGQGFATGLLAAVGVVAATILLDAGGSLVVEFWLDQLGQKQIGPATFAAVGASTWVAATVGGWLGGQLVPADRSK